MRNPNEELRNPVTSAHASPDEDRKMVEAQKLRAELAQEKLKVAVMRLKSQQQNVLLSGTISSLQDCLNKTKVVLYRISPSDRLLRMRWVEIC